MHSRGTPGCGRGPGAGAAAGLPLVISPRNGHWGAGSWRCALGPLGSWSGGCSSSSPRWLQAFGHCYPPRVA
eukprot:7834259-Lingulodinium_polyedra.AAC.1